MNPSDLIEIGTTTDGREWVRCPLLHDTAVWMIENGEPMLRCYVRYILALMEAEGIDTSAGFSTLRQFTRPRFPVYPDSPSPFFFSAARWSELTNAIAESERNRVVTLVSLIDGESHDVARDRDWCFAEELEEMRRDLRERNAYWCNVMASSGVPASVGIGQRRILVADIRGEVSHSAPQPADDFYEIHVFDKNRLLYQSRVDGFFYEVSAIDTPADEMSRKAIDGEIRRHNAYVIERLRKRKVPHGTPEECARSVFVENFPRYERQPNKYKAKAN